MLLSVNQVIWKVCAGHRTQARSSFVYSLPLVRLKGLEWAWLSERGINEDRSSSASAPLLLFLAIGCVFETTRWI